MTRQVSKSVLAAVVFPLLLGTAGCITNGDNFRSDVSWIKAGQTKQADAKMIMGEPYSVGNAGGKQTWTYGFYRYKLFGKSLQKELKLYWNPDGTVSSYSYNSSFPNDTNSVTGGDKGGPAADF